MTAPDQPLYVLDSFAILAHLQDEPAADAVEELLRRGRRGDVLLFMAVVNLGEVLYKTVRRHGSDRAEEALAMLNAFPIETVAVGRELALAGAQIKGSYRMSYADCIATALAQDLEATLVTGDPEFRQVEGLIAIEWLPGP